MKFRPLHDRVVIRRIEGDEKTKGGIIIPDTAKENRNFPLGGRLATICGRALRRRLCGPVQV